MFCDDIPQAEREQHLTKVAGLTVREVGDRILLKPFEQTPGVFVIKWIDLDHSHGKDRQHRDDCYTPRNLYFGVEREGDGYRITLGESSLGRMLEPGEQPEFAQENPEPKPKAERRRATPRAQKPPREPKPQKEPKPPRERKAPKKPLIRGFGAYE